MKRLCSVPSVVCYHSGQNCKTERYISSPQVKTIFNNTGIVLPVGTGLCTKCRKSLLKQAQCEELSLDVSKIVQGDQQPYLRQETHISDHEMTDNVPEFSSRTTVDSYSQPNQKTVEADEEHTCMSITNRRKRKAKECLDDLVLSQETDQSLAGGSQVSEASVCVIEKLDKLNEFLSLSGISPVKKIQGPLESASARTIQRYKLKARQCLNSVFETICPGEAPFLEAELYPESLKDNTMKTLLEIYTKADTWMFLTEQLNYDALRKMIPNITQWRYYEAKRHTDKSGAGQPVQPSKQQREKFDAKCLEHFIDFITSNQIIKDLPFGDKTLRLSTGEIRNIPNVVRSIAPVSIIKQYNQLCEEDQVKPLGTSTLYKLLDECAASVRKSMEGLDNYITEGGRAFVELEKLVVLLPEDTQALKARLQEAKQYLKTDMKIHVRQTSTVADHCAPYALSTSDPCFKGVWYHEHDSRCDSCSDIADLFDMLLTKVIANTWKNRDSVLYTMTSRNGKKHLVRACNQEEARRNLTDKMNENEALITFDWAMKFLPRKYREGPCDRKASHIKSSIKRYVNEGNDVITAQQMKQAIDQNQQGKYKVKVVNAVTNLDSGANIIKSNIPEITSLHNFKFTEDALVVWKAYNIGEGKTILWTQLKSNSNKELSVVLDWRDVALTRFQEEVLMKKGGDFSDDNLLDSLNTPSNSEIYSPIKIDYIAYATFEF
ncbi:unnamed protein product [Mytilus edulis]|uniref:Uncharacterized protein n=1 Tax=Mytilus edulis TaxID=6550 RepID=A0A8S3RXW8_MYTED|nr:unnamed protein product [Mytilus edulis]